MSHAILRLQSPVSMTTNVASLSGGLQVPVGARDQSVRPSLARSSARRRPVVRLLRLPAVSGRRDGPVVGRRPSDVYGETARERWTNGRRPVARSAAAIRAARAARSAGAAAPPPSNCSSEITSTLVSAASRANNEEESSPVVDAVANVNCSTGDVPSSDMKASPRKRVLSIRKFYESGVATEPRPLTAALAGSDSERVLPVSASNGDRKRKSSRQQAAKRVRITYSGKSPNDKPSHGRNATSWSAYGRGPLINSRRRNAARLIEMSTTNDESIRDRTTTSVDACDDALPVVAIDEKYATRSLAAINFAEFTDVKPTLNCSESLTTKQEPSPVGATSISTTSPTFDSSMASLRSLKSRNRAEHTIFERFINALSLHKPPASSDKHVEIAPVGGLMEAKSDSVSKTDPYAKLEIKTVQRSSDVMDNKLLGTIYQRLSVASTKVDNETFDNSMKLPPSSLEITTPDDNPVSDVAENSTGETKAGGKAVEEERACGYGDAKPTDAASKRQNEERKTRGVKLMSELLVTKRPVRKRQPSVYIDSSFQRPVKSDRKMDVTAKSRGSCLLPSDFNLSLCGSPGATRKSWKTVFDGPTRPPNRRGRGRPRKNKQRYGRHRGAADDEDEVKWTVQKKLLLDGPKPERRKSAVTHSKFPGKRKLKSPSKSTTFMPRGGRLRTRSVTRIQRRKSAGDRTAPTTDESPVTPVYGGKVGRFLSLYN